MTECTAEINFEYRSKINAGLAASNRCWRAKIRRRSRRRPQAKGCRRGLDEITKPLADLMMDRAMEALLRKRGMIR